MNDLPNIPVIAMTRDGAQKTTMVKALDDFAEQEAIKAKARRCSSCGKYQAHEQLKTVPTEDGGTQRLCGDCLDDDPAAKALYRQSWAEALETIDLALEKSRCLHPVSDSDSLAKSLDRLAKSDPIANFGHMVAHYRREWMKEDRLVSMVKAEKSRQDTKRLKKQTKRLKKSAQVAQARKAAAMQAAVDMAAQAEALQAEVTAQVDGITQRVNRVVANAERAYGAISRQRDIQATAQLARQDQERARWYEKAGQTTDPILRQVYLAKAAGQVVDDED